jgi:hypothetical protein
MLVDNPVMGTLGRWRWTSRAAPKWARGLILLSWVALAAGACSGSTSVSSPTEADAGDAADGQLGGDGPTANSGGQADAGDQASGLPGGSTAGGAADAGGVAPAAGHGGAGGSAGQSGGGAPGIVGSRLGRACVNDADCQSTNETDLTCITETSTALGNGAPPGGLCSRRCVADDECVAHSAGALCYPLGISGNYCVEGCRFGAPEIGESKCHSRPEFACDPALLASTGDTCEETADCEPGDLCVEGTCNVVIPACLPACRGDIDCAPGMYCDQSFLAGLCTPTKPEGKRLGEPCTVPADDEPSEPDGCLGFCQADSELGPQGHCSATCATARECAWDAASQRYDGVCLYAWTLTSEAVDVGDFGFCTPSCNCSEQCNNPALSCQLLDQGRLNEDAFTGAGLCFSPDATATPLEECAVGGSGAGGATSAGGAIY